MRWKEEVWGEGERRVSTTLTRTITELLGEEGFDDLGVSLHEELQVELQLVELMIFWLMPIYRLRNGDQGRRTEGCIRIEQEDAEVIVVARRQVEVEREAPSELTNQGSSNHESDGSRRSEEGLRKQGTKAL